MIKTIKNISLSIAALILLSSNSLKAQDEDSMVIDTSYFKAGMDDQNLLESVIKNDARNTSLLLARGANPNITSSIGNTPVMYAAEKGNMEIMRLLIENGAEVNTSGFNGETALFLAIFRNDFQAAKYLLEQGADPNIKDGFGVTPLIYAAATNQYQSADLLMFYEADENVTDEKGNDPLLAAVTFENLETSDVLLQNGLNPDVQDKEGNTPAIVASQHGNYEILDLLLDYHADVNISNNKNYTPLAYALTYKDVRASKMLLKNGADVNHEVEKGRNMAELARISGSDSLISMIKENGGVIPLKPVFSELQFSYGNSFNKSDYLMQFRAAMVDSKYGYFFETGFDFRPVLLRIQISSNDTIFQFRESRPGWSHGFGKNFTLFESSGGLRLGAYGSINGYLSVPKYAGSSSEPGINYTIIPSAGLFLSGKYVGVKTGFDWYNFNNLLDKGLKINITAFFRISYPETNYDRKEIHWE